MSQKSKFFQWIDYRVRITLGDGRMLVGTFLAFDKHLNVILSECEEYRIRKQGIHEIETKRTLGMIIVRGDNIISLSAEAPPHQPPKKQELQPGPGKAQPITRQGVTGAPNIGLISQPKGMGLPGQQTMMPAGMNMPPM
ncbi:unnamed protein product [Paramecium sonneborni]|uniref:Sm domain-containing protein n=1 Tax=Paramecium sonneborni TaxID=65129 RepID=A0A8S1RDK0_9CILI|nr:unnamed protein product [Paramecium sonneborni]CAD8126138.1 unnamed protein product [Paramecium sonneborni]